MQKPVMLAITSLALACEPGVRPASPLELQSNPYATPQGGTPFALGAPPPVWSPPFLGVDLKRSIDEGYLVGPRVVASGPGISATGGHGDLNNYAPQVGVWMFPDERDYQIADGVDQIRHVVRSQLKYGVDVIKV